MRLHGVLQQPFAYRPLTVDKTPDGSLIYAETPRACRDPAKHLDAMGEVGLRYLHCNGSVILLPFVPVSANRLALLLGLRRGEIGVLIRHPIDKFADRGVSQQAIHVDPVALKF